MNELQVFSELHKFLNGLGSMNYTLAPKSLTLGYKPFSFSGGMPKFATLYGEKRYNCLILHVDPGNQESLKGKMIQKDIQELFHFNIKDMRSFTLKKHEVYVPFEVIHNKDRMEQLKDFVRRQYEIFVSR
ncbi:hypothetical protein ACFFF5_18050 [Lederbergia wuyishanensis]|uniref:YdhG-like domain-containing protein n=1 Tax=Lederbergia wuyishanensis TaxID=1347903 RepID=A0ABU0D4M3_9BACI|nr:hypothetical protein [Lederbergia wuyishanensis]MCJ8008070.1 hypothetical protein [Lederbergia wuyishanensis]MDQ0343345.1 hypothetical protein [Lederbergia wuyishanensis]